MADLALLNEELQQNIEQREALRRKHPGKTIPGEDSVEFSTLTKRSETLVDLIEVEKQRQQDAMLQKQRAYFDEPVRNVPHTLDGDGEKDDIRRLLKAGWESKNGILYAPTSTGQMFAMAPEDVLVGPIPSQAGQGEITNYVKQARAVYRPEYKQAWVKYVKNFAYGDSRSYSMLEPAEQKALSEGLDPSGGYTVPPDIQAELGGRRAQTAVMRSLCTVRQTVRDVWQMPMVAPHATAASRNIYKNGFVGSWVGETPTRTDVDPVFEMFTISIRKASASTKLSNDLIADSTAELLSRLSSDGAENLALLEDSAFIAGTGVANEPLGILSHPLALTLTSSDGMAYDVEGSSSNAISNSVSDAGSAPKIKAMSYTLPSQYADNATWLMRRGIQGDIAALVDGNGRPFWNSYLESGLGRPAMSIEGSPVRISEFMGTDGSVSTTPATTPLLLGDFSQAYIIERTGFSVRILNERYAETDQTGIIIFARVGFGMWNYDAFRTGVIAS